MNDYLLFQSCMPDDGESDRKITGESDKSITLCDGLLFNLSPPSLQSAHCMLYFIHWMFESK